MRCYSLFMNNTLTNDEAAKMIAKMTAKLTKGGRKDLADLLIASASTRLGK